MEKSKEIKYYHNINKIEITELYGWLMKFIVNNKKELVFSSVDLVEYQDYKISISIQMNLSLHIELSRQGKSIYHENFIDPKYLGCDKVFMDLLLRLKKIIRSL